MMLSRMPAAIALALIVTSVLGSSFQLKSRINTEESYRSPNVPSNKIYSIQVKRVDSTKAQQVSRCWSVPRSIRVTRKEELFRLSKVGAQSRSEKVYEKLTSLSQQENIIEEFEIVGDKLFVVTTDGSGYFIALSNPQEVHRVQTNLHNNAKNDSLEFIVLKQYKERVLIITSNNILLCKLQKDQCEPVSGYKSLNNFRGAELVEENGRYLLFIISADALLSYELTANGEVKNQQTYDSSFFGTAKLSFRSLVRGEGASFYILDDIKGVWQIEGKQGLFKGFIPHQKIIFEQFGCYQMISDNAAHSLILACNPSLNNFFLMNLARSTQYTQATYEPLQTIFLQQQIYQISSAENILMGRVYSGVKLFWSSQQIGNPYPYFYRKAGDVFLHNAIQSKLKVINETKTIFLAAEDELLKFQFRSVDPFVSCYSPVEVNEEYKLVYEVECREQSIFLGKENVCSREEYLTFETWEHKEVRVGSDILPFILSLVGVIAVGYVIRKIYKQYNNQVDEARRKYNIQSDQLSL